MVKRQGNFIEEHIEKAVLAIAALASIYLLYAFVIRSPYRVPYDRQEFAPGQIDTYISNKADRLRQQLNSPPDTKESHEPCSPVFMAMFNGEWAVDTNMVWPVPMVAESRVERQYRIPTVGGVKDVAVEEIRAAAYVPVVEITRDNANLAESYEPNDIDFVTVQGTFDMGELANNFQECFMGSSVPEGWRDSELARPVFAAVNLQRQHLGRDSQWGEWKDVPRARIEPEKETFRIIENAGDLPSGGIMVRVLRFADSQRQTSLLQPEPYKIASAEEEWFPPVLHRKFLAVQREREAQERREMIAAAGREDERGRGRDSRTRRGGRSVSSEPSGGAMGDAEKAMTDMMSSASSSAGSSRSTTRTVRPDREQRRQETTTPEQLRARTAKPDGDATIYDEMDKILLAKRDIGKLREPIVLWAYDDTVEPGSSYRYRMRVGVFNPVAGTGQVSKEDQSYADKVMLWGGFSDVTPAVDIPRRMYFFPMSVQETSKAVDVQVCKYAMGYWYSEQFMVKRGDAIGRPAEAKADADKVKKEETEAAEVAIPKEIDYSTGVVVVDVVTVNDWSGGKNLQPRLYFDMLYSYDGAEIERTAAKLMCWPEELRTKYTEIKSLEKKPREALRAWSSGSVFGIRQARPGTPAGEGAGENEMLRMMMQMQQQQQMQ